MNPTRDASLIYILAMFDAIVRNPRYQQEQNQVPPNELWLPYEIEGWEAHIRSGPRIYPLHTSSRKINIANRTSF